MKTTQTQLSLLAGLLFVSAAATNLHAHEHMPAGATSPDPGATLQYAPTAEDFTTNSGFVFNFDSGDSNSPYAGYYFTDEQVFESLPATSDFGGPQPGHAALGTFVQVKLLGVEGPAGASFGFWEAITDGVDSTNLTWSVPVPYRNGTNLIPVTQSDGSATSDPYGHLHGRIYSVTKPGLYTATWQFVDTSTNGPGGGPVDLPSAPFATYYQADFTIAAIQDATNSVNLTFAALSNQPEDLSEPPTIYIVERTASLGPDVNWQQVGSIVTGDDTLHILNVTKETPAAFFRLQAVPGSFGGGQ